MNGIFLALLGTMATFLVTVLGSAVIFFVRNEVSDNLQCGFLGFAGGVMVAASVWSLILPGIDFAEENGQIGWLVMTVGFLTGVLVLLVADGCLNRYLKKMKETKLLEKAREKIKHKKMLFADQDAIFWTTTSKKIIPRIYNEQSKFNKKDTIICHFCKRMLWFPYPRTENIKQWQVENVHKILKCHAFDNDLEEYKKYKKEYEKKEQENERK